MAIVTIEYVREFAKKNNCSEDEAMNKILKAENSKQKPASVCVICKTPLDELYNNGNWGGEQCSQCGENICTSCASSHKHDCKHCGEMLCDNCSCPECE